MSEMDVSFTKMNGLGNKIIVADMRGRVDEITPQAAIALAGDDATSFDQIMAVRDARSTSSDAAIRILNSDGSPAEACGNGMRCVVAWHNRDDGKQSYWFEAPTGRLDASYATIDSITVNMGVPRTEWDQIPLSEPFADTRTIELQIGPIDNPILHTPSAINIGNPHVVFWVEKDVWAYELESFGPMLEHHLLFPDRANISIAQIVDDQHIDVRTWERGAGITEACGSAACAAAVSAARKGQAQRQVTITVPGGDLMIDWRSDNFIHMTGPAEFEFEGRLNPETGAWTRVG
ncbi:MAG: diaminopimelate epimerase [Pseudomonadota bacterium]